MAARQFRQFKLDEGQGGWFRESRPHHDAYLKGQQDARRTSTAIMKDRARMMDEAKAAQRLECNILFDRYMERAEGLELAMKDLAKAAGLTVCPDCHKICRLETLSGNEYGDGKRRLVFICDDCVEEGPVEIVGVL